MKKYLLLCIASNRDLSYLCTLETRQNSLMKHLRHILSLVALTMCLMLQAHDSTRVEGHITYSTELQTNLGKRAAWMNQLRLEGAWNITQHHSLQVATLHTLRVGSDVVVDDNQVFSNLDNPSMWLGLAVLGYEYHTDFNPRTSLRLFGGVRNMNEDYFTSPMASLFCNSSDGIFPTLSANHPLANYPYSALAIHGALTFATHFTLQTSLYNGVAGETLDGACFRFRPRRDRLVQVTSLTYEHEGRWGGSYTAGHLVHVDDSPTSWFSLEQNLLPLRRTMLSASAQLSWNYDKTAECRSYYCAGLRVDAPEVHLPWQVGAMYHHVQFATGLERSVELTGTLQPCRYLTIQPSLQHVITPVDRQWGGILRARVEF